MRKLLLNLVAVLIGSAVVLACSGLFSSALSPAQERAMAAHECYVAALEPALGPLTEDVLRSVLAGGNFVAILAAHRLSPADILATATRWRACDQAQVADPPALPPPAAL